MRLSEWLLWMVVTGSAFCLFVLIVPNGKNVGIWPQTTMNFWSSNYPFHLLCEWIQIWTLDSERCEDFIQLQKFFSSWKQTFSFLLSCTFNISPKGNDTLNYFLHFLSEMFALILPEQVFTWVNNLEGQITPHNQDLPSDSHPWYGGQDWFFRSSN